MAEDIEAKIRRLRELGKIAESKEETPTPTPAKPPRRRFSRIGTLREKERRKRVIIGAVVLSVIIIAGVFAIYMYFENKAVRELENAKNAKIAEVNACFKGELANDTVKFQLINKIMAAKSIEELEKINVNQICEQRKKELEEERIRAEQERLAKELAQLKNDTKESIKAAFGPLLQVEVPDEIKKKIVSTLNDLLSKVDSAKTKDEVLSINVEDYLLPLWKEVYIYKIDSMPTSKVILKKGEEKRMYTKEEAKLIINRIGSLSELLEYNVEKVELVQVALVLSRENVVGGFIAPGDEVKVYAKNGTTFREIVPEGYVVTALLSTDAGRITVSESQQQTTTASSTSSTSSQQISSTSYSPGDVTYQNSQQSQTQSSVTQTTSESLSSTYTYSVNLGEILKAIAAGKIKAPESVRAQLSNYGWEVLDLEQEFKFLALPEDTRLLVIIEVPSEFVPEILNWKDSIVVAKVSR
ncbi:DUF515 domain-containing protein [Pyrococcus furiosus DSM 3638]|uniref:DUF515 domain-containing protein n=3 Tax=Pyrococcus furiosus TaxID=2261 RepID=A0A5C0XV40_PYRFU|nr:MULTISPECIES: DUF515 domain-containing protein [Pyrococcus]AAL81120.1 hypothetical protein PF0996 [Pyrococcus furiosus DSM 3638]AFN03791.1 hypothetical protein PFC_04210 [Pyrococcus furiosus COM1]MDK2870066.1 hypothetical protein [Pyrococcus sp.]QEK78660.1 DUF515 domain-containing protein [Pyrococcus furiosus DSM 3638]